MQNHWSDDDTVKKMRLEVSKNPTSYDRNDDTSWKEVAKVDTPKTTSEQRHDMLCEYWSRYWRFTVLETYGNRSAINHLRLIL